MSTESPCHQKSPETCIPMCGAALGCKPQQDYEQPLSQQNPRDVMLRTTEYYDALESTTMFLIILRTTYCKVLLGTTQFYSVQEITTQYSTTQR